MTYTQNIFITNINDFPLATFQQENSWNQTYRNRVTSLHKQLSHLQEWNRDFKQKLDSLKKSIHTDISHAEITDRIHQQKNNFLLYFEALEKYRNAIFLNKENISSENYDHFTSLLAKTDKIFNQFTKLQNTFEIALKHTLFSSPSSSSLKKIQCNKQGLR